MEFDISTIAENDGTLKEGFVENLPEDVRKEIGDSKYFDNIKTVPDLFKSAAGLSKLSGKKVVPSQDASDEEWDTFVSQLGVPESAEEYGIKVEGVTEEQAKLIEEQQIVKRLQDRYKAAGIPKRMAHKLASLTIKEALLHAENQTNTRKKALGQAEEELKKDWGADYEANNLISSNAMSSFHPETFEFIKSVGMENHPAVKRLYFEIAQRILPGNVVMGQRSAEQGKSLAKTLGVV